MPKPKPGVVLLLAYLAFVSLGLPDTVLGVAWPSLRVSFDIPQSAMGAVLAAGMSGYFVSGLWAGGAVARFGVGGVLALSSALVAVALFAFALAPSWAVFFPFGAVMGLGSGAIDAGLNGYAARHFSVRHVNWLHGCWGIGASLGPALMTLVIAEGPGYRAGYALLATVLASMALLFSVTRRRWDAPPAATSTAVGTATSTAVGTASTPSVRRASASEALRNSRVWLQIFIFFLYTGIESSIGQWCFSWLRERRGLAIEAAGSWTSAYWASLTVGRLVLGSVADTFGPDRLLRCSTLGAVLGVTLFVSSSSALGNAGLLLLGASLAPLFPTLMARTPARVGSALSPHAVGFQVSAATLGSTLMPSLIGVLVARHGLSAMGAVVVSIAIALLLTHELLLGATRARPALSAE